MKKVLLLTASYGTGHISAAKSINEVIKFCHPDWEVKIVDYLTLKKCLPQGKLTFFQKLYNFSMEIPILFDLFFFITDNRFCTEILKLIINFTSYKNVKELLNEFQPDIIVSTHPYWNFAIKKYKKEEKKYIPYICVVTDSYMIHKAWIDKSVDYYCVMDEDTKHILINHGIKNIFVTGFPVSPRLFEHVDKKLVLEECGLDEKKLTILITVGLGAVERFVNIIDYLRIKPNNFQMIIITGKYKTIYDMLITKKFIPKTKIIGWTDRMYDFIRVSDLVICKGGGAIVSESLSGGVPVFIPVFVPGQERGNMYIVKKYQMGFHEEDISKVYSILDGIIEGKIQLDVYKQNISKYCKWNPARIILSIIEKVLR